MKNKKKFYWRSFVSFGLFLSFLVMTLSGVILYIAPPGRVANWSNWELWGLTKAGWQSLHTNFSLFFLILGIFHLFSINWKAFLAHIRTKATKELNRKKEMVLATLLTVFIFIGVIVNIPPFKTIMVWGESLTESWEKKETSPPIPHAELYSLEKFSAEILDIPLDSTIAILKANKISFDNKDQTIKEIGKSNGKAPSEIFLLFGKYKGQVDKERKKSVIIQRGNGIGKKSLQQIGEEYGIPVEEMIRALEKEGFKDITSEDILKDIAGKSGVTPADILKILNNRHAREKKIGSCRHRP